LNGELFDLPAGPLGFAAGVEYRVETLNQDSDVFSQSATFGWESATTLDPFNKHHEVSSIFGEIRIPIFGERQSVPFAHSMELDIAVRHEKYSDTDDPTVPKFSFSWHPVNDEFMVRATYSKSFSAPTLFNLFGPGGIGFTDPLNLDRLGGGVIQGQANIQTGANASLKPSTSKNYTFGVVWSPKAVKGFSITMDYFDIKQRDLITTVGAENILQDVETRGTASPYVGYVRLGPPNSTTAFRTGTPISAAGQIGSNAIDSVYVTDTLTNIASVNLKGVDAKILYTYTNDQLGRFDASTSVAYYKTYTVQTLPSETPLETAGYATNTNGTIPRWQSYTNVDWSLGHWRANIGWQHIPAVTDVNGDGGVRTPFRISSYDSFDVSTSFTCGAMSNWTLLNGMTVRIGANNVLNKMPPFGGGTFTDANADIDTYSPIGRMVYVDVKFKF
jgi:iron complex outermembrane receptor protein